MTANRQTIKYTAVIVGGLLIVLCILPQTRYALPGLFVKKTVSLQIVDTSGHAVAGAVVTIGTQEQKTDASGNVILKNVLVGDTTIRASAMFYNTAKVNVNQPLFRQPKTHKITLASVGEITKVTIINRVSGRAVVGANIIANQGGKGITNSEGMAIIFMPKGVQQSSATVTGENILSTVTTITSTQSAADNTIFVTPKGRISYLQKNDTKSQVITSNLDGTDAVVLLDGTGNEDIVDTQLINSAGNKFVALKAKRDTAAGLYIIDVATTKLAVIENSGQSYIPIGWRGDVFVYLVYSKRPLWQVGTYTLKVYDAISQQSTVLDESKAEGVSILDYASEVFENVYIVPEGIVYAKKWQASYYYGSRLANKRMTIVLADERGNKQDIAQWQAGYNAFIKTRQTEPRQLSVLVELDGVKKSYYTYNNKSVREDAGVTEEAFKKIKQDIYFVSPNNLYSVWQTTNNKNYVGTVDKTNASVLQLPMSYRVIGWFTNDYVVLLDTANSDLKIVARDVAQRGGITLTVGTTYMASTSYTTYGYGR